MSEKFNRFVHKTLHALAGRPAFVVNLELPEVTPMPGVAPSEIMFGPEPPVVDKLSRASIDKFTITAEVRQWAKLVRSVAAQKEVSLSSLWVLLKAKREDGILAISVSLGSCVIALRDPVGKGGAIHLFVPFLLFADAVEAAMGLEFKVIGTTLTFQKNHVFERIEGVVKLDVSKDVPIPVMPPTSGFALVRGLGLAMREASGFTKYKPDYMGRHAILVFRGENGIVHVIGTSSTVLYRREVQAPQIEHDLYIESWPQFGYQSTISNDLGVLHAGDDVVWLASDNGLILGLPSEPIAVPREIDSLLAPPGGRIEFSNDEFAAFRRGVSQFVTSGSKARLTDMCLNITGATRCIEFGDPSDTRSVTCTGDNGPGNMAVNAKLVLSAAAIEGIHAIEFSKVDPAKPIIFVGPGVRVAVATLQPKE